MEGLIWLYVLPLHHQPARLCDIAFSIQLLTVNGMLIPNGYIAAKCEEKQSGTFSAYLSPF
jgi:hypothetical protein